MRFHFVDKCTGESGVAWANVVFRESWNYRYIVHIIHCLQRCLLLKIFVEVLTQLNKKKRKMTIDSSLRSFHSVPFSDTDFENLRQIFRLCIINKLLVSFIIELKKRFLCHCDSWFFLTEKMYQFGRVWSNTILSGTPEYFLSSAEKWELKKF